MRLIVLKQFARWTALRERWTADRGKFNVWKGVVWWCSMKRRREDLWGKNIREIIFGVEDGAIGNLGLVIGMIQGMASTNLIILAGLATMIAQAISMSAGNYLSIKSEKEYFQVRSQERKYGKEYSRHKSLVKSSFVMGLSVIIGAAIPLSALFLFDGKGGIVPPLSITLVGLFLLGMVKACYTFRHWLRSGMEVVLVGFCAALAGYLIGSVVR